MGFNKIFNNIGLVTASDARSMKLQIFNISLSSLRPESICERTAPAPGI